MLAQIESGTSLLRQLQTVVVPARTTPFVVRDTFKKGAEVNLSQVWDDFKKHFFGKIEKPAPVISLCKYQLLHLAADKPIIEELGGEDKVETTLSSAYALMKRQPRGEAGVLQTNGYANIFYVKDEMQTLCAVRIGWAVDGWVVDSIPVADPLAWNGQHAIFCPADEE